MSKVICEVCGTMYPDTAVQCPICGSVRSADGNAVSGDAVKTDAVHAPVRGGRFSKSNVRKRNSQGQAKAEQIAEAQSDPKNKRNKVDIGLTVLLIVLLLAIICVSIYIGSQFLFPRGSTPAPGVSDPTDVVSTEPSTAAASAQIERPCTDLKLSTQQITFAEIGATQTISATMTPADTTDTVTYHSSDPKIVTVDAQGKVTAVGNGEALVVVTCGKMQVQCRVSCKDPKAAAETTAPTQAPTKPTEAETTDEHFALEPDDITFFYEGEGYTFQTWVEEPEKIVWSSDDTDVVTVKDGALTAVDGGTATITAKYKNKTAICIVRCNFERIGDSNISSENQSSGGNSSGQNQAPAYIISHIDVTIGVNESFVIQLSDTSGNSQTVNWVSGDDSVCTVSGNVVTGAGSGMTNVYCTYGGVDYICIIRVR